VGKRHICESKGKTLYVVSKRAKEWLAAEAGEWVSFRPIYSAPPPRSPFVMMNAAGRYVDNPTRQAALDYVTSLGQEDRKYLQLVNSRDWSIVVTDTGYVGFKHATVSFQVDRCMRGVPREKQIELWLAFFDADRKRLMAEVWQTETSFSRGGPAGPGELEW
jgi:hypothetical protein